MKTCHREQSTGHTAAFLKEVPAMGCDGLRWAAVGCDASRTFKITAKCSNSSHRVARPIGPATRCDADHLRYKPGPHAVMSFTCDGAFHLCCDARKSHAMCCNRKFNMLNILVSILEYLRYLLSQFQTVLSILMGI